MFWAEVAPLNQWLLLSVEHQGEVIKEGIQEEELGLTVVLLKRCLGCICGQGSSSSELCTT